jgi:predicted dehydrogenase
MSDGRRARIAVVGTGWWATQYHLPSLAANPDAEIVALSDPDATKLGRAAEHFAVAATFADHRTMLETVRPDGVVIAVPHAYHYEIARDAIAAGAHVLVEKPMVLQASQAWDLVTRARERGVNLAVGYTYHATEHARLAHELITSGRLGEIIFVSALFASMVESYYRGAPQDYADVFGFPLTGPAPDTYSDPAISGGGQGQTQVTHAMGMVLWATGLRVTEVSAFMQSFDLPVDLVDAISYRLNNGAIGTMASTGSLRPGQPQQQEIRYYGTNGFLLQELIHGTLSFHPNEGPPEVFTPLTQDEIYPAAATSAALVDLVLGRGENRAPGEVGAAVVEFIEAAYRSVTDRKPVRVGEAVSA